MSPIGSETHATRRSRAVDAAALHPSGPLPVQGPPLGSSVRVVLGETGLEVFPLMLGAAEFGWRVDQPVAWQVLDRYAAAGGNIVHTADSFAGGRSDHIVGQWLSSRGIRDEIVVASRIGRHPDNPGLDPVNLVRAVEASLVRLSTDRIDLLYLDATDERALALEDTLATVEWLIGAGKVRHLGVYGMSASQLVEARILSSAGYPRIAALDVAYNVLRRDEFDADLRLVASAQSIAVTPSTALEHGFLSGHHRARGLFGRSVRGDQHAASANRRGTRTLKAMDVVGAELGIPDAAVAVAWLLAQRAVVAPIVNAFAPDEVDELVQGVGARLSRGQLADIARAAE